MSLPLEGEHLCKDHQGNTSHYATENCTICQLRKGLETAKRTLEKINISAQVKKDNDLCSLTYDAVTEINKCLR